MSENNLLTNDKLQSEIRDGYPDSVDFFLGKEISIKKKKDTDEDANVNTENDINFQNDDESISGLENLILGFSKPRNINTNIIEIDGQEGIRDTAKSFLAAIWKFIKDIGEWIYNLFNNKIARIDARIKHTNQVRKIKGIKDKPVKYLSSIKLLFVPSMISTSPNWVNNAVKEAESFYKKVITGHKTLKEFIPETPANEDELTKLQTKILNKLGTIITGGNPRKNIYQTDILPGNRIFNIKISTAVNSNEILTYFTDSSAPAILKSDTWEPTSSLIDEALGTLNHFRDTILKEQTNTSMLIKNFSNEIEKSIKLNKKITKETKSYYLWLGNLNKRLTNTTLQYATYCIESLDDFINSGLK